mmetsp:Transcript_67377/g.217552  ORF Transcript_67377/g.217552 Transcript_67377/m.217552 type:complete len:184 (+) Transcript_67377:125-676(+)
MCRSLDLAIIVSFLSAAATLAAVDEAPGAAAAAAALAADDECLAAGGEGRCALNAMQRRGEKTAKAESGHFAMPGAAGNTSVTAAGAQRSSGRCARWNGAWCLWSKACEDPATACEVGRCLCGTGFCYNDALGRCESEADTCHVQTGGTCVLSQCDVSRGSTSCVWGRCECTEGHCAVGGRCV